MPEGRPRRVHRGSGHGKGAHPIQRLRGFWNYRTQFQSGQRHVVSVHAAGVFTARVVKRSANDKAVVVENGDGGAETVGGLGRGIVSGCEEYSAKVIEEDSAGWDGAELVKWRTNKDAAGIELGDSRTEVLRTVRIGPGKGAHQTAGVIEQINGACRLIGGDGSAGKMNDV